MTRTCPHSTDKKPAARPLLALGEPDAYKAAWAGFPVAKAIDAGSRPNSSDNNWLAEDHNGEGHLSSLLAGDAPVARQCSLYPVHADDAPALRTKGYVVVESDRSETGFVAEYPHNQSEAIRAGLANKNYRDIPYSQLRARNTLSAALPYRNEIDVNAMHLVGRPADGPADTRVMLVGHTRSDNKAGLVGTLIVKEAHRPDEKESQEKRKPKEITHQTAIRVWIHAQKPGRGGSSSSATISTIAPSSGDARGSFVEIGALQDMRKRNNAAAEKNDLLGVMAYLDLPLIRSIGMSRGFMYESASLGNASEKSSKSRKRDAVFLDAVEPAWLLSEKIISSPSGWVQPEGTGLNFPPPEVPEDGAPSPAHPTTENPSSARPHAAAPASDGAGRAPGPESPATDIPKSDSSAAGPAPTLPGDSERAGTGSSRNRCSANGNSEVGQDIPPASTPGR